MAYMTERQREQRKREIDDYERARNRTPPGPERDEMDRVLDEMRDAYEDDL